MTLSSTALLKHQGDITLKDVVTEPQEILALFASKKQQDKGKIEQNYVGELDMHVKSRRGIKAIILSLKQSIPLMKGSRSDR